MKGTLRKLLPAVLALCCFAPGPPRASASGDAREAARRLAAEANDAAVGVEDRREALRRLGEAARLLLEAGETAEAAAVLGRAGRLQLALNDPRAALAAHGRALALLARAPAPQAEVDNLNGLGAAYARLALKDEAERALRGAAALAEQAGYVRGQAEALLALSERQNDGDHPLAERTARAALALWQSLDDKAGVARARALLGQYLYAQNLLPESAEQYEAALALRRVLNDPAGQAEALIMLGYIEHRRGEWAGSISLLNQALGLVDAEAEPERMGQISTGLAEAFNQNGLPELGAEHFRRALEHYRRTQDPELVAYATYGLGQSYYLAGDYAAAAVNLRQALGSYARTTLGAECQEYLGRVYAATGDYAEARRQLEAARAVYTRAGNVAEAARALALLGQVAEREGRADEARRDYSDALRTFERLSQQSNRAAVLHALGGLELKRGDYAAAEAYLRRSVAATEDLRRAPSSSDLIAAFSATVHERYEKYVECLMRLHAERPAGGLAARAFETSELARARSLAELLRDTQTNLLPGLDPRLAEREHSLRHSLRVKEDAKVALLAKGAATAELPALEAELARLEEEHRRVGDEIRARHPAFGRMMRPAAWDLRRIQQEVVGDGETVLLEYALGGERSYVWAVTRDGFESYALPAGAEINRAARKVYALLSASPADGADPAELARATRELSRMVLSPVAAELNRRRLVVVADGALNYIPFQMLPSPTVDDEPLVAAHEVVNAPSASILGELRQEAARRRPATKVLAAFGDPVFASDYAQRTGAGGGKQLAAVQSPAGRWWPAMRDIELNGDRFDPSVIRPLLFARRELANLGEVAGAGETLVAADFAATRAGLLDTDLSDYAILHFATHGFLDPRRPENSGLVLSTVDREGRAQDGFVGLQDVYSLRAPVGLVVLSACRTGLGKDVRGEGLLGLTRGFMYAGASSVVASLWKVDDEATAELMKQFYTNMLRRGMTPPAALREAQNSIRREPRWRSPYYWAAFTLQGEYNRPIRHATPARPTPLYVKAAGGFTLLTLLTGAGLWYGRRRLRRAPRV